MREKWNGEGTLIMENGRKCSNSGRGDEREKIQSKQEEQWREKEKFGEKEKKENKYGEWEERGQCAEGDTI